MAGCERCTPSWQKGEGLAACDLLDTYSYLCYQMPGVCAATVCPWLGWMCGCGTLNIAGPVGYCRAPMGSFRHIVAAAVFIHSTYSYYCCCCVACRNVTVH